MKTRDISFDDIETALFALDSWLDAFGDDEDFEDAAPKVHRVASVFRDLLGIMESEPERPVLKLVKPPTSDSEEK